MKYIAGKKTPCLLCDQTGKKHGSTEGIDCFNCDGQGWFIYEGEDEEPSDDDAEPDDEPMGAYRWRKGFGGS